MYVQFFIICLKRWCSIVENDTLSFPKHYFRFLKIVIWFFFNNWNIFPPKRSKGRTERMLIPIKKKTKTFFKIYWILKRICLSDQPSFAHVIHFKISKPFAWMFLILIYTSIVIWWYHFFEQVKQLFKLPFLKKKLYRLF